MESKKYNFFDTKLNKCVLTIEMNRLEKRNAFSPGFIDELCDIWDYIENSHEIRIGVLRSKSEEYFSAGADLEQLIPLLTGEKKPTTEIEKKVIEENLLRKFYRKNKLYKKPIIGISSGHCLAGGFELLLSCDFKIISTDSKIGFPETKLGLIPAGGGISRIVHSTSRSRALEILINSSDIDISKLLHDGIVNEICMKENLDEVLDSYIERLLDSESEATEILLSSIDKFKELNLTESFLLEEELLKKLSDGR